MVYRGFVNLVNRLPLPSQRVQVGVALAVLLSQAGIAVTGSVVRVTASGLGCPTWPQCFPGSFTPTPHTEVPGIHQAVEFGNRMLTFAVVITAALVVIAVTRANRRREVRFYAWLMPLSTVVQAVVGGLTVLAGLAWWTVAIHLMLSMGMVWLAVLLLEKVREPDDGQTIAVVPAPLRWLTAASAVMLTLVLIAGTMVTGAGPHAGDKSIDKPVPRLKIEITTLVHFHAEMVVGYFALLVGLGFGLLAVGAPQALRRRLYVAAALVMGQGLIGLIQYLTNVPSALVVAHVAGATACVAATGALWVSMRPRVAIDDVTLDGELAAAPSAQR